MSSPTPSFLQMDEEATSTTGTINNTTGTPGSTIPVQSGELSLSVMGNVPWPESLFDRVVRLRIAVTDVFHGAIRQQYQLQREGDPSAIHLTNVTVGSSIPGLPSASVLEEQSAIASQQYRSPSPVHGSSGSTSPRRGPSAVERFERFAEKTQTELSVRHKQQAAIEQTVLGETASASQYDTTIAYLKKVEAEVNKLVQRLADSLPSFSFEDDDFVERKKKAAAGTGGGPTVTAGGSGFGAKIKQAIDERQALPWEEARRLYAAVADFKSRVHYLETELKATKATCLRKDNAIDYIRSTLWQEVAILRESAVRQSNNPSFPMEFISLFDYAELLKGDGNSSFETEEALKLARKDHTMEVQRLQHQFARTVKQKDIEIETLRKEAASLKAELEGEDFVEDGVGTPPRNRSRHSLRSASFAVDYQQQIEVLAGELSRRNETVENLKETNEIQHADLDKAKQEANKLTEQIHTLSEELERVIELKDQEIVAKARQLQLADSKVKNLEATNVQSKAGLARVEKLTAELMTRSDQLLAAQRELINLKNENQNYMKEVALLKVEGQRKLQVALDSAKFDSKMLSMNFEKLQQAHHDLQDKHETLQERHEFKMHELTACREELELLATEQQKKWRRKSKGGIDPASAEGKTTEASVTEKLEERLDELTNFMAKKERENETLQKDLQLARAMHDDSGLIFEELDQERARISDLTEENFDLKEVLRQLTAEGKLLHGELASVRKSGGGGLQGILPPPAAQQTSEGGTPVSPLSGVVPPLSPVSAGSPLTPTNSVSFAEGSRSVEGSTPVEALVLDEQGLAPGVSTTSPAGTKGRRRPKHSSKASSASDRVSSVSFEGDRVSPVSSVQPPGVLTEADVPVARTRTRGREGKSPLLAPAQGTSSFGDRTSADKLASALKLKEAELSKLETQLGFTERELRDSKAHAKEMEERLECVQKTLFAATSSPKGKAQTSATAESTTSPLTPVPSTPATEGINTRLLKQQLAASEGNLAAATAKIHELESVLRMYYEDGKEAQETTPPAPAGSVPIPIAAEAQPSGDGPPLSLSLSRSTSSLIAERSSEKMEKAERLLSGSGSETRPMGGKPAGSAGGGIAADGGKAKRYVVAVRMSGESYPETAGLVRQLAQKVFALNKAPSGGTWKPTSPSAQLLAVPEGKRQESGALSLYWVTDDPQRASEFASEVQLNICRNVVSEDELMRQRQQMSTGSGGDSTALKMSSSAGEDSTNVGLASVFADCCVEQGVAYGPAVTRALALVAMAQPGTLLTPTSNSVNSYLTLGNCTQPPQLEKASAGSTAGSSSEGGGEGEGKKFVKRQQVQGEVLLATERNKSLPVVSTYLLPTVPSLSSTPLGVRLDSSGTGTDTGTGGSGTAALQLGDALSEATGTMIFTSEHTAGQLEANRRLLFLPQQPLPPSTQVPMAAEDEQLLASTPSGVVLWDAVPILSPSAQFQINFQKDVQKARSRQLGEEPAEAAQKVGVKGDARPAPAPSKGEEGEGEYTTTIEEEYEEEAEGEEYYAAHETSRADRPWAKGSKIRHRDDFAVPKYSSEHPQRGAVLKTRRAKSVRHSFVQCEILPDGDEKERPGASYVSPYAASALGTSGGKDFVLKKHVQVQTEKQRQKEIAVQTDAVTIVCPTTGQSTPTQVRPLTPQVMSSEHIPQCDVASRENLRRGFSAHRKVVHGRTTQAVDEEEFTAMLLGNYEIGFGRGGEFDSPPRPASAIPGRTYRRPPRSASAATQRPHRGADVAHRLQRSGEGGAEGEADAGTPLVDGFADRSKIMLGRELSPALQSAVNWQRYPPVVPSTGLQSLVVTSPIRKEPPTSDEELYATSPVPMEPSGDVEAEQMPPAEAGDAMRTALAPIFGMEEDASQLAKIQPPVAEAGGEGELALGHDREGTVGKPQQEGPVVALPPRPSTAPLLHLLPEGNEHLPSTIDVRSAVQETYIGTGAGSAVRGIKDKVQKAVDVAQFLDTYGEHLFRSLPSHTSPNTTPFLRTGKQQQRKNADRTASSSTTNTASITGSPTSIRAKEGSTLKRPASSSGSSNGAGGAARQLTKDGSKAGSSIFQGVGLKKVHSAVAGNLLLGKKQRPGSSSRGNVAGRKGSS